MLAVAGLITLCGCSGDLSTLDPAGPNARNVAFLWWIMLAGGAAIFLLVGALLVLTFTRNGGRGLSNRMLVIGGGLVFPTVVLTALVATSLALGERLLSPPGEAPLRIHAIARQWQWQFRYPDAPHEFTLRTLHIPTGRPVDFEITSGDVIHSFWIPRLGGKIDAIPGHTNTIRLQADAPGYYGGVCAEFCGNGHAVMRFAVQAHEPAAFEALMQQFSESEAASQ